MPSSFVDVVRRRTERDAERLVFTFLEEGEREAGWLTAGALDAAARAVAVELVRRGLAGERALLLFPPGLDFVAAFIGCLYAGVIAVPAYPPAPGGRRGSEERGGARLGGIVRDAAPRVALTTAALVGRVTAALAAARSPAGGPAVLAVDALPAGPAERWSQPALAPHDVAFLQYTSGSTADPKGVVVTHGNLLANAAAIERAFAQDGESIVVGWLPLYHDMGLIGNVLQPLWSGGRAVLMAPLCFLQRPRRWLEAIARYRATTSGGPDFAYALCADRIPEAARAGLDLASWRVAFDGSEPVRAETLDRFAAAFAAQGFRREAFLPCYGLAEATLFVAGAAPEEAPTVREVEAGERSARRRVGCGRPPPGTRLAIVDPQSRAPLPPGREGEIWVAGPGVAAGYWRRPLETAAAFGDGAWLRTGDLGRLDAAGELFVGGRIKDLVILRGGNHAPQDLELTAEASHPAARPGGAAAFGVEAGGEERLVVVCEIARRREAEAAAAAAAVRRALVGEHGVSPHAVVAIRAGGLPRTSSGKLRRGACREQYLAGRLPALAAAGGAAAMRPAGEPRDGPRLPDRAALLALGERARRAALARALAAAARPRGEDGAAAVDAGRPLALDSLEAVTLRGLVAEATGVELPLATLLAGATPHELAEIVALGLAPAAGEQPAASDEAAAPGDRERPDGASQSPHPPLSLGQRALWLLHRIDPASPAYNVALAAQLAFADGRAVRPEAVRAAAARLTARHPALRMTIETGDDGEPVQRTAAAAAALDFAVVGGVGGAEGVEEVEHGRLAEALAAAAWRPFDLRRGPLVRWRLVTGTPPRRAPPVLLLAAHHVAVDLQSLELLLDELGRLLAGEELPPLARTPFDFAHAQRARLAGPAGERLWEFWRRALEGAPPRLELPADRPRPAPAGAASGVAASRVRVAPATAAAVRAAAAAAGTTVFSVLLAAFQAFLARLSGAADLIAGAPAAGRTRPGFEQVVGYFVNLLPLRAHVAADPSFAAHLVATARTTAAALEHQDFPFPLLVERLQPRRGAGGPLVQAVLAFETPRRFAGDGAAALALGLESPAGAPVRAGALALVPVALPRRALPFPCVLLAGAAGEGLLATLELDGARYDRTTAVRFAGHFRSLLAAAVADPHRRLSELPLLSPAERAQLLVEWNDTAAPVATGPCLHLLATAWAGAAPERPAVAWRPAGGGEGRLTYGDLASRAERLARRLAASGVSPEARVALFLERSPELLVAILGVLLAGGAFAPLDPSHPRERLAFLLEDCGAGAVVTTRDLASRLPAGEWRALLVEDEEEEEEEPARAPAAEATRAAPAVLPENLAYVLHTSGSSGRPKGVLVPHRAAVNLAAQGARDLGMAPGRRLLQVSSFVFDAAVLEVLACWSAGATLCLAGPQARLSGAALADDLEALAVDAAVLTPSVAALLPERPLPRLAVLLLGGESVPGPLAARWSAGRRLLNGYGPTEAAVYATIARCPPGAAEPPPIGRPIANARVLLLDRHLRPVPAGVAGEICIAGAGLARGYLGRPERTAERFVPDPTGAPGERLYRSGDRGRLRADGQVEFLGRLDEQVKVRGVRVEPGEVEAALREHPAVAAAAVVTRPAHAAGDPGGAHAPALVAYVVPAAPRPPDLAGDLRAFLAARLPAALVPTWFVLLPALPLLPTGKLDRGALPAPAPAAGRGGAPRGELERTLAAIWSELLGVAEVGTADNFFDLGGHSLLLARAQAAIARELGREVPLVLLFDHPTVASLAARLARDRDGGAAERPQPAAERRAAGRRAAMAAMAASARSRRERAAAAPPDGGRA